MMDTVLSLANLADDEESGFLSFINSGDSINCGSSQSHNC